jgi:hypothetical protein
LFTGDAMPELARSPRLPCQKKLFRPPAGPLPLQGWSGLASLAGEINGK